MTTKDKIKTLIGANKQIAQVIGALPHLSDYEDKQDNADILAEASNAVQEVVNALCDELPDQKVFIGDSRAEPSEPLVPWTCGMCGRHLLSSSQKVVCVCGHELSPKEKDRV